MQLPIGYFADKTSYRIGQISCSALIIAVSVTMPIIISIPILAAAALFLWGGVIGGMNSLAVIEAGNVVNEEQISTAMALIAVSYTLGSITGPIITGILIDFASSSGLLIAAEGLSGLVVILLIFFRK
ncbi:MAG: MFS transporter [Deferribacteraceae bacterium]|jgi:predicted MFS family arabinose efflux permease|nr:MFS transporter [Deferribacteraceae bacterium]